MKKFNVIYSGGESRKEPGKGIDFMLVDIPSEDGEKIELYAEADFNADREDDTDTYEILKAEIIQQAKENNMDARQLAFMYD